MGVHTLPWLLWSVQWYFRIRPRTLGTVGHKDRDHGMYCTSRCSNMLLVENSVFLFIIFIMFAVRSTLFSSDHKLRSTCIHMMQGEWIYSI